MTPLQQRMIEDMTVRGLAQSTQQVYLRAVRDLAAYYKRSPDTLSTRDIQRYLLMLHEERDLTYATCNTIAHGLRFFYGTSLGRSAMHFTIPLAKEPSKLPIILSRHDIRQLFAAAESLRDQTLLKVTYNAGLRASEVVHLPIAHIDSRRMCLRIEQGKRQKDREALLSPGLLQDLWAYWRVYRLTGCKFSREHTLLSLALVEAQNKGRVWCRQKNVREAGGAMMTQCASSLPVLFVLSNGLLATYACIFFHYFNRLWRSEKLATSYGINSQEVVEAARECLIIGTT